MEYRVTYCFNRDDVYTTCLWANDNADLMYLAKKYISQEHGTGAFKKLIAFSFIQREVKGDSDEG